MTLLLLLALQDAQGVLDRWNSDDLSERDRATEDAIRKWNDWTDADLAAFALGQVGDRSLAKPLAKGLSDSSPAVVAECADALGLLGAAETARDLLPLLESEHDTVRAAAARALGWLDAREHADAVAKLLGNVGRHLQLAAIEALGTMGARRHAKSILPALDRLGDGRAGFEHRLLNPRDALNEWGLRLQR